MEVVRQIKFDYSTAIQIFYIPFAILLKVLQSQMCIISLFIKQNTKIAWIHYLQDI